MSGTLWIVATPIGTLGDLSPRAAEVLTAVECILAEDTRRTRRLLSAVGVAARGRLRSLHEHNEERSLGAVIDRLNRGESVALVSDAGTPVLADPGFLLVRQARREGIPVSSVPGPSALTAALAASGQPPLPAALVGFLPPRRAARQRKLRDLLPAAMTLVIFLSPHRLRTELEDLETVLGGERPATLLAELSKQHERGVVGTLAELVRHAEGEQPRGEYVVVVGPPHDQQREDRDAASAREVYETAVKAGLSRREALRHTAQRLGVSRREVFAELERDSSGGEG
jgi:16S rRNA (cytidine1402-2'-O)-methyltransferase